MSKKSTKIIAVAGVIAGLGVAALPAMTFATASVSGQVNLTASVEDAIAMTIKGNVAAETTNPAVDVKYPSGASDINGHSTGTAYDPLNLQVSSSSASLLPNSTNTTEATSEIKVWTNATAGYSLTVKAGTTGLDLIRTGATDPGTGYAAADKIEANAAITAGQNHWAYKVGEGSFTAITVAESDAIATSDGPVAGDTTNVTYGFSTLANQNSGTYTGSVIYTASTN